MHLTALFRHKYNYLKLINKYISIFLKIIRFLLPFSPFATVTNPLFNDKAAALADRGLRERAPTHVGALPSSIKVKIIINYPVACMLI